MSFVSTHRNRSLLPQALLREGALLVAAALALPVPIAASSPDEPEGPRASAEVQDLLDEAERRLEEKGPEASLRTAEQALAKAREVDDAPGWAFAHQGRARALEALDRREEALAAWRDAASAWEFLGAAPEEIEALGATRSGDL